jgi:flagellar hook-associated protein 3 FlgL
MPTSDFRVSNRMLVDLSLANLADNVKKLTDLQDQASSLKRLRRPSDAPADVVSAMGLRADLGRNDQISRNIDDATAWLGTADNALQQTVTQLQRVNDLMVQARNTSLDATSRAAIASQIDSIKNTIIGLANTQYAGRAIFAGTASGGTAYSSTGTYVGVSSPIERTVGPGQRVQVNVNGDEVFGTPGNDLFTLLGQISDAVRNDPTQLDTLSTTFDGATNTVQTALAEVGARFQRVSALQSQNSSDAVTMKKNLSDIEDADIAQVMMNLQTQQVAYQAALQATARAIQPSLADFLQ